MVKEDITKALKDMDDLPTRDLSPTNGADSVSPAGKAVFRQGETGAAALPVTPH